MPAFHYRGQKLDVFDKNKVRDVINLMKLENDSYSIRKLKSYLLQADQVKLKEKYRNKAMERNTRSVAPASK
jgi:hypothetical protein